MFFAPYLCVCVFPPHRCLSSLKTYFPPLFCFCLLFPTSNIPGTWYVLVYSHPAATYLFPPPTPFFFAFNVFLYVYLTDFIFIFPLPPLFFCPIAVFFMFAGCALNSVVWCAGFGCGCGLFSLQGESGERGSNNPGRDKRRNGVPDLQRHSPKKVTILSTVYCLTCCATGLTDCCTYSYVKTVLLSINSTFVLFICRLLLCMPLYYFCSRTYFTLIEYEYRISYYLLLTDLPAFFPLLFFIFLFVFGLLINSLFVVFRVCGLFCGGTLAPFFPFFALMFFFPFLSSFLAFRALFSFFAPIFFLFPPPSFFFSLLSRLSRTYPFFSLLSTPYIYTKKKKLWQGARPGRAAPGADGPHRGVFPRPRSPHPHPHLDLDLHRRRRRRHRQKKTRSCGFCPRRQQQQQQRKWCQRREGGGGTFNGGGVEIEV